MLSNDWLSAFAPVGVPKTANQWTPIGACVFFHKPPLLWMVTARHILEIAGPRFVSALVTRSSNNGVIVVEVGKILADNGLSWVEDESSDLAAAAMPVSSDFGIKAVTQENCVSVRDLEPSMQCYTIGCPYGLHGVDPQRSTPLVLDGVISGVNVPNRKVYTSAPTFPGNSGGPLIAVRNPFTPQGNMTVGRPTVWLAGIMLSANLLQNPEFASPIPPLHLGVAASTDAVLDLLGSDQAQAITARLAQSRAG